MGGYNGNNRRDFSERLSDTEVKEIRAIIQHDKNARWFWATVRNWSVGIAAVVTSIAVGYQAIIDFIKHAIK